MIDAKIINQINIAAGKALCVILQKEVIPSKPTACKVVEESSGIILQVGITGDLAGTIIVKMNKNSAIATANALASTYGMSVSELDDMTISMLSELSNQLAGSISTSLSEIDVRTDITPPTVIRGNVMLSGGDVCLLTPFQLDKNIIYVGTILPTK